MNTEYYERFTILQNIETEQIQWWQEHRQHTLHCMNHIISSMLVVYDIDPHSLGKLKWIWFESFCEMTHTDTHSISFCFPLSFMPIDVFLRNDIHVHTFAKLIPQPSITTQTEPFNRRTFTFIMLQFIRLLTVSNMDHLCFMVYRSFKWRCLVYPGNEDFPSSDLLNEYQCESNAFFYDKK